MIFNGNTFKAKSLLRLVLPVMLLGLAFFAINAFSQSSSVSAAPSKKASCLAQGGSWDKHYNDSNGKTTTSCTGRQKDACENNNGDWKKYRAAPNSKLTTWQCDYSSSKTDCKKNTNTKWNEKTKTCATNVAAVTGACGDGGSFFGLPTWYKYLPMDKHADGSCSVAKFCVLADGENGDSGCKSSSVPLVLLALIEIVLRLGSIVAVVFVVVGGFKFVTSQGEPEGVHSARNIIINALIGLVITLIATPIVSFIGNRFGG